MPAGSKIQHSFENTACDNKENGQRSTTGPYVFLFYGLINSSGFYQQMSLIEEGSLNYFKQKFVCYRFYKYYRICFELKLAVLEALSCGSSIQ